MTNSRPGQYHGLPLAGCWRALPLRRRLTAAVCARVAAGRLVRLSGGEDLVVVTGVRCQASTPVPKSS
jgi:hypothetical protein